MASFCHTIPVGASSVQLWALVRDVARVAGLFPYTTVEELTSPEPECWFFWRQLTIPNVADLRWRERARVTGDGELHFEAVEGDLRTFAGSWRVVPNDTAAVLTLALEYEIPEEMRPKMPPMMIDFVMGEIFRTICQRVKEAAEEDEA